MPRFGTNAIERRMNGKETPAPVGSLTVVGTGISLGQITLEAQLALQAADAVFCVVLDEPTMAMLESFNSNITDLQSCYALGKLRRDSYDEMVESVVSAVRSGKQVCFALYGHPCVFAWPSREAVRILRAEGFEARILPGVSAEDCLFADLGIDPAEFGCQSYEATSFVRHDSAWDPYATLILWQVGLIGEHRFVKENPMTGLSTLIERLSNKYGPEHEAIVYEAANHPIFDPLIERTTIQGLLTANIEPTCTIAIQPLRRPSQAMRTSQELAGSVEP